MIVTFTPSEDDVRKYTFDPRTFPNPDAERIEELTGLPWAEANAAIMKGSAKARRALVFCFERRAHPSLSWAAFGDFPVSAIQVDFDRSELETMAEKVDTTPGLSEADKAAAREQFATLMEDAPEVPKAPEPQGVSST